MELYYNNRKLLLLNHDLPFSTTSMSPEIEPPLSTSINNTTSSSTSSEVESPFQLPPHPVLSSNIGFACVGLISALFIVLFVTLFLRRERPAGPTTREERVASTAKKSLPEFPYSCGGDDNEEEEQHKVDECAICLEEFREGEKVKMMVYCNHVFHPYCIDTWLLKHVTCPICRCNKLAEVK